MLPHVAFALLDGDPVADLDRPLDQQDQPRDEVVDDGLQAEADADRQGAGDDGEAGDVEAGVGDGGERGDGKADVAGARVDGVGEAGIHLALRQRPGGEPALHETRRRQQADEQGDGDEDACQRDAHAADVEAEDGGAHPAHDLGAGHAPGKQQQRHRQRKQQDVERAAQ